MYVNDEDCTQSCRRTSCVHASVRCTITDRPRSSNHFFYWWGSVRGRARNRTAMGGRKKRKPDDGIGGTWLPAHARHAEFLSESAASALQTRQGAPVPAGSRIATSGPGASSSLVVDFDDELVSAGISERNEVAHLTRHRSSPANFEPQRFVHMVNGRPVVALRGSSGSPPCSHTMMHIGCVAISG